LIAGRLTVEDGKIIKINNWSGHYQPFREHLSTTVENAFKTAGYGEGCR
jgi:hypothetical protein